MGTAYMSVFSCLKLFFGLASFSILCEGMCIKADGDIGHIGS